MRTTLNLDPTVLSAARAKAAAERISLGKAVSALALAGLSAGRPETYQHSGFPVLSGVPGRPVTDELVARYLDDESLPADVA